MSNSTTISLYPVIAITLAPLTLFGLLMIDLVVTERDEARAEALEKIAWCEEFHTNLTYRQCSVEAGW